MYWLLSLFDLITYTLTEMKYVKTIDNKDICKIILVAKVKLLQYCSKCKAYPLSGDWNFKIF